MRKPKIYIYKQNKKSNEEYENDRTKQESFIYTKVLPSDLHVPYMTKDVQLWNITEKS